MSWTKDRVAADLAMYRNPWEIVELGDLVEAEFAPAQFLFPSSSRSYS